MGKYLRKYKKRLIDLILLEKHSKRKTGRGSAILFQVKGVLDKRSVVRLDFVSLYKSNDL